MKSIRQFFIDMLKAQQWPTLAPYTPMPPGNPQANSVQVSIAPPELGPYSPTITEDPFQVIRAMQKAPAADAILVQPEGYSAVLNGTQVYWFEVTDRASVIASLVAYYGEPPQ